MGYVETDYERLEETPIQTSKNREARGTMIVFPDYAAGLAGLEGFDYAYLITLLDRIWEADGRGDRGFTAARLRATPFLLEREQHRVGVFACRFPVRPNYLGLSLIRIASISGCRVEFSGVDLLNRTPVLDIKPWAPQFDVASSVQKDASAHVRTGWLAPASDSGVRTPRRESFERAGVPMLAGIEAGGTAREATG